MGGEASTAKKPTRTSSDSAARAAAGRVADPAINRTKSSRIDVRSFMGISCGVQGIGGKQFRHKPSIPETICSRVEFLRQDRRDQGTKGT